MTIFVETGTQVRQHQLATTWHIDDLGMLHIINKTDASSTVASYAKGEWSSVTRDDEGGRPAIAQVDRADFTDEEVKALGLREANCGCCWVVDSAGLREVMKLREAGR